ncbi:MAG: hypothetical protein DWQ02_10765 [Bacteroidetes bacterium]|nr:MAG: hypothetical protein DWQ02_10765 [Bacteroidota bacterium]
MVFVFARTQRRQMDSLKTYELTLENTMIVREQFGLPTIIIDHRDISVIEKNRNGSFVIRGEQASEFIIVPPNMEESELLEKMLGDLHTIQKKEQKFPDGIISGITSLGVLILMALLYTSENKIVIGVSGALVLITMAFGFFYIRNSKHFDDSLKKNLWIVWIIIFSVLGFIYYKLTGT